MNKTIRVDVTQENIFNGQVSTKSCPIALALNRAVKPEFYFSVYNNTFNLIQRSNGFFVAKGNLLKKATNFVDRFDRGLKVKPFSFDLTIPEKYLK